MAILFVLLYHLFPYIKIFSFGWIGVDLFFVLSGLLISGILIDTKNSRHYYLNYLAKRVLRIFPLYYFFLLIFFLVPGVLRGIEIQNYEYLKETQIWYWSYLQNWLVVFDNDYPTQNFLSHFWSLAIEEQFYIFWPLIILIVPTRRIVGVCCFMTFFSLSLRLLFHYNGVDAIKTYVFTFARLDGLCLGSALAAMLRDDRWVSFLGQYVKKWFFISMIAMVMLIVISRSLSFTNAAYATVGFTLIDLFFCCVILMALSGKTNMVKGTVENRFFTFFGKYSYGLYVYHLPIYRLASVYLRDVISGEIIISLICFTLSVAMAMLSYHLLEKHFLKLKARFSQTMHTAKKAATTVDIH